MQNIKLEDIILLLDTSRSMLRNDFKPNRLKVALQAAKNFIQSKFSIDPKDRISIITFGETAKKLSPFSYDEDKLINSLKKIEISGKGNLHEAIALSLQIIIQEMRKIGGKIQRIFIISDGKLKNNQNKLQKMVEIAKGLGISIDSCQIGKPKDYIESTLKKVSQKTNGEYGYFNNPKAIINAGKSFASKKMTNESMDYFSPNKNQKTPPLISEIALILRRPTIMEIHSMMIGGGNNQEKCAICHSIKAPLTNGDFYIEGRYCPNCDRPMHLSCAVMWAKKSESEKNLFRCPFCFFLLELPKSATKLVENKIEGSQKINIIEKKDNEITKMVKIPDDRINQIDASCSYCRTIFNENLKVFQCKKCGSFYHESCLEKMYNEMKACRFCGAEINFD
ncbi:MAG: VWA domain-containing protein [Promethearchaeota archaeon]